MRYESVRADLLAVVPDAPHHHAPRAGEAREGLFVVIVVFIVCVLCVLFMVIIVMICYFL